MIFAPLPVPAALSPWVEFAWSLEGTPAPLETILPDGRCELVFHFGGRPRRDGSPQSPAFLVGQLTSAVHFELTGRLSTLGVRLRPAAAGSFLRLPAHKVQGRFVDLDFLHPTEPTWPALATALLAHAKHCAHPDPALTHAASLLLASHGTARIDEVARAANLSPRHLDRCFLAHLGLSPKVFARLLRFQSVLGAYQAADWPRWAELALDCGFYDQAHLATEFRHFAGLPPTQFFRHPSALALLLARR